jgi:glutathionyl-hydroquinone reductase
MKITPKPTPLIRAANESADIVRMMNSGFGTLAEDSDLYPGDLNSEIDALNEEIYVRLNNGVYRAGFASSQEAYEEAFWDVFGMLDALEGRLRRYHGLLKCNLRRVSDYPYLRPTSIGCWRLIKLQRR